MSSEQIAQVNAIQTKSAQQIMDLTSQAIEAITLLSNSSIAATMGGAPAAAPPAPAAPPAEAPAKATT